jgi:hypothetical protein
MPFHADETTPQASVQAAQSLIAPPHIIRIEQMTQRQTRPGQMGRPRTDGAEEAVADYYVL